MRIRKPAFEVAHLAAGGSQVKDASGGPAGAARLKMPPAALPGANLLKRLINKF